MKKDQDHVKRVAAGLKLWVSHMWKKERPFVNFCDGTIASDEMVRNVLFARKTRESPMKIEKDEAISPCLLLHARQQYHLKMLTLLI